MKIISEIETLLENSKLIIDEKLLKNILLTYQNAINNLEISYEVIKEQEIDYFIFKKFFKENRKIKQNVK
ncbi:hypothetical protein [Spiroplasma taiwanense]|uniref:Uncharacterized protein n=1 Tax=Spiroplasma taiwanense CT-1 TaxID=1276220 RepID=S5LU35_9MOLU|nr:hypothetical protein [Spiroplasma taiwanense]AGR41244.1 hypothetical protein STAIW_v1c06230 [Spiroplasma taiwanense CT-1]